VDVLTWQEEESQDEVDTQEACRTCILWRSYHLDLLADIPPPNRGLTFHHVMFTAQEAAAFLSDILQMHCDGIRSSRIIYLVECKHREERHYSQG
jgi:hypothetical protein